MNEPIAAANEPTPQKLGQTPVPVVVEIAQVAPPEQNTPSPIPVAKTDNLTLPPTTTEQDDKVTAGQRSTSLMWESTQAIISVAITGAVIYCAVSQIANETITNAFFFIVATYFTRTNHTRVGGVAPRGGIEGQYKGR